MDKAIEPINMATSEDLTKLNKQEDSLGVEEEKSEVTEKVVEKTEPIKETPSKVRTNSTSTYRRGIWSTEYMTS